MTESSNLQGTPCGAASASDIPDYVHLNLWLRDADLVQPLLEYPEGQERDDLIRRALRISLLALRQALDEIATSSGTIKNSAEKILSRIETMRKALERQVGILNEQVVQLRSSLGDTQSGGSLFPS